MAKLSDKEGNKKAQDKGQLMMAIQASPNNQSCNFLAGKPC